MAGGLRPARAFRVALVALAAVAGACTQGPARHVSPSHPPGSTPAVTGSPAITSPPSPSPSQNPYVAFGMRGGDAFAWTERVAGTADCHDLTLQDNGRRVDATIRSSGTSFSSDVTLSPGANRVVARCTPQDGTAQESVPLAWNERLQAGPTASIRVTTRGRDVILNAGGSRAAEPDGARIVRYTWHEDPRHPSPITLVSAAPKGRLSRTGGERRIQLVAPKRDGEYYVSLTVTDAKGRRDTATTYYAVDGGVPRAVDMAREHPSWIDSAVIYAPIPLLWGNGGPKAVERRLPYLKRLGVDALWLWPPAERRMLGEEYRITDYFHLDPSWGPPAAFKHMVDTAHRLGLHVMLDFVPNHTSVRHPYYLDQQRYGKASHYYDFYDRNAAGRITEYTQIFGTSGLPNLNYDNPEVRQMIIQACLHWVRDFGIDGFRMDAAWGVQRRRPTFWAQWRAALKRVDPDLLLLGEATALDAHIFRGYDLAYDWTDHPGQWAWTSVFDFPQESGALLKPAITNDPKGYPADALVMRFLNNNDTDVRFVDRYGPELTRVAATLQFTVPGVPEMFAGDEIGASYQPYSNLTPIPWRDRFGLRPFYERLISLRHRLPSLASRDISVLDAAADSTFAYVRPAFRHGAPVLVLLNFGDKTRMEVPNSPALAAMVGKGTMRDLLTDKRVRLTVTRKTVSHEMDAESAFVLVPGAG
ncbi:MAG: alpha-amylase family glycosyl hydrolase [Actinomycetota bacterium]